MRWRRWVLLLALAAAILLAITFGMMPRRVPVEMAKVTRGPLRVTIEEEGKTRVKDRFLLSAPVAGFVQRIDLLVGDNVARGQAVAMLEPMRPAVLDSRTRAEAAARVDAAKSALDAARENARVATADDDYVRAKYERTRKLHESGFASDDDLERADSEARRALSTRRSSEFAVEVARFDLDAARTQLKVYSGEEGRTPIGKVSMRAPVGGRVLGIPHKDEGAVEAGRPLIEIGDPRALEVEVDVLSHEAVRIRPGTPVLFERWGGEVPLEGKVRTVEPAGFTKVSALGVEEQRVLVIADITSPAALWERLGDGYRLEAVFIIWDGDGVLQVPASSLFRYGEGWAAFVPEGGRARRRTVEIGRRNGLVAQILSGLAEGETVITHPSDQIGEGTRVRKR